MLCPVGQFSAGISIVSPKLLASRSVSISCATTIDAMVAAAAMKARMALRCCVWPPPHRTGYIRVERQAVIPHGSSGVFTHAGCQHVRIGRRPAW